MNDRDYQAGKRASDNPIGFNLLSARFSVSLVLLIFLSAVLDITPLIHLIFSPVQALCGDKGLK